MTITWNTDVNAPSCPGEILAADGRSVLIQTDYDLTGVASTFGWDLRHVQAKARSWYFDRFELALPEDAIEECHHQGDCDEDVTFWAGEIDRPDAITPELLATELREYGAWDQNELADDAENWKRIIWIAAGNLAENVCNHAGTDGTVDCPDCGVTAGQFIAAAGEWLADHDGATADDPGYFES